MKLRFDSQHNPIPLTLVLAKKDGTKLGTLPAAHLKFHTEFNSVTSMEFSVYKSDLTENVRWRDIVDFKLLWLKEFDLWFEIHTQLSDGNVVVKHITATSLAEKELSQTNIYGIQVNTEDDIMRDDYKPTIFYDDVDKSCSLLHRLLAKTPHYSIKSVATSLRNIQRTFSFDGSTTYDSLMEVAEEIGCYFDFAVHSNANGKPDRRITVYDLQSYCLECRTRGEFKQVCTECESTNIQLGYGRDSGIYVSTDNLTDEIVFETNEDSVKNCFKLESGDELMDATVANCNPNGSSYLWYIPQFMKDDMPVELQEKLNDYDELCEYYQDDHTVSLASSLITRYNTLITKYLTYNNKLTNIPQSIKGFPALMVEYYNTIDFALLLQHSLMPGTEALDTTAEQQVERLTVARISPVAVYSKTSASASTVDSAVLAMAKAQIDYRYQVKIISSSYSGEIWTGSFVVTNYYDEEDNANSSVIQVNIIDTYENYVEQMLEKSLSNTTDYATDIVQMFQLGDTQFAAELKKYSLNRLKAFDSSCEACLNILIEQGAGNSGIWSDTSGDLYNDLYLPYRSKRALVQAEIALRESEINTIVEVQEEVIANRNAIQTALNFENYLGIELWKTFIAYRREDTYSNPNYISDGLDNAEMFNRALQFIEVAKKDLYKSANLQHSLSATLKNLLAMKEFEGLTDDFEMGNYIHIKCDSEVYDVRLMSCEIDFENLVDIQVTFSDVQEIKDIISDIQDILNNSKSMASTYDNVKNQAEQGNSSRKQLDDWTTNGLALTAMKIINSADNQDYVFDEHGMLFRKFLPLSGTYHDEQLKIINSTIAITNDNWNTVKTAVGSHYYIDPLTNELKYAYGINGEVIIGKIVLGEQLGIYNSGATLQFNKNGLTVTNDVTTFTLNPNTTDNILTIVVSDEDVLRVSASGLYIAGEVVATSGTIGGLSITNNKLQIGLSDVSGLNGQISTLNTAISTVEREAKAYADSAVSTFKDSVEATYATKDSLTSNVSTLNTAISTVEREAKAYADSAVASMTLTTSVNGKKATITLKATDKDGSSVNVDSDTINFTGLVSFTNLSTSGGTTINGGNITTGTISADYLSGDGLDVSNANISKLTITDNIYFGGDTDSYLNANYNNGSWFIKTPFFRVDSTNAYFSGKLEAATGSFSGSLSAATGSFSGAITASSGTIGGWVIEEDGILHATTGIYGQYRYTTTGTDLKYATGYAFASLSPDGFYYVIKDTNSWSGTIVGIISIWGTMVSGSLSGGSGGGSGGGSVII